MVFILYLFLIKCSLNKIRDDFFKFVIVYKWIDFNINIYFYVISGLIFFFRKKIRLIKIFDLNFKNEYYIVNWFKIEKLKMSWIFYCIM